MSTLRERVARLAPWGIIPAAVLWVFLSLGYSIGSLESGLPDSSVTGKLIGFYNSIPDTLYWILFLCAVLLQTFVLLGRWPCWVASGGILILFLVLLDPGYSLWLFENLGNKGLRYDFGWDPDGVGAYQLSMTRFIFIVPVTLSLITRGILTNIDRKSVSVINIIS